VFVKLNVLAMRLVSIVALIIWLCTDFNGKVNGTCFTWIGATATKLWTILAGLVSLPNSCLLGSSWALQFSAGVNPWIPFYQQFNDVNYISIQSAFQKLQSFV